MLGAFNTYLHMWKAHIYVIYTYIQELKEGRKEKRSEGIYVIAVFEFEHLESVRVQVYMNTQL
jgi:hypothetical protein